MKTPPTWYFAHCVSTVGSRGSRTFGAWAHDDNTAHALISRKIVDSPGAYMLADDEVLGSRKFKWSDGKLLFAHVEQSEDRARKDAEDYREDRRNKGQWSVRIFPRNVRAGDTDIPCWAVVVRHKFIATGQRQSETEGAS